MLRRLSIIAAGSVALAILTIGLLFQFVFMRRRAPV